MHTDDDRQRVAVRPATAEDVRTFYGRSLGRTLRAFVMTVDGEVKAMAGLSLAHGFYEFFSDIKPDARRQVRRAAVIRQLLRMREWFRASSLPVIAAREPDEPGADQLLKRLGFQPDYGDFYRWHS